MEELLSLKWNNHRSTFIHILGVLRDKQQYTDAVLACEGKFYNVHKLVMSTCSDYFSAMFDKTACKNPVIVLKDIKSEDLEALLDYMYLGEVNVRQCDLSSLIKSAECLRIKGLAVPDDEPPKKPINKESRKNDLPGSPPAKKRRREDSEDKSQSSNSQIHSSPNRPKSPSGQRTSSVYSSKSLDNSSNYNESPSKLKDGSNGSESGVPVKVEMEDPPDDDIQEAEQYDLTNENFKEENMDDMGDMSNDLPEFLQSSSSDALQGAFPSDSYAGPSDYQGDMANWQGDNSNLGFPSHMNFGSSDGSSQQNAPGVDDYEGQLPNFETSTYQHEHGGMIAKKTVQCQLCGHKFRWHWMLLRHMKTHTGEKPFSCPHCSYRASRKEQVTLHNMRKHLI